MKIKNTAILFMLGLFFLSSTEGFSKEKKEQAAAKKKTTAATPAPVAIARPKAGDDVESLFATLNETLEENRKIRTSLKEVQQTLQGKIVENQDLKKEMGKLESLALERNRELTGETKDLKQQIKDSEAAMQKFETEKRLFYKEKERIEKESIQIKDENEKLRKTLATSVLEEEKEAILKAVKENGMAAQKAEARIAQVNIENQIQKNELIAAQYQMGNVLFQMKRYPEAVAAYKKVIERDPTNAWAYHNMAVIEDYYLNDSKSAYIHYQRYLDYKALDEEAGEVRRRVLDLNFLSKLAPETPLKNDFEKFHQETRNAKI